MDDLVTWLRAQLDEDTAAASTASSGPWRPWQGRPGLGLRQLEHSVITGDQAGQAGEFARIATASWLDAEHIARHDPARVLAEVDAKRRILDEHRANGDECRTCCGEPYSEVTWDGEEERVVWKRADLPWPCPTVRLLALPYADRPGYRDEWRPA